MEYLTIGTTSSNAEFHAVMNRLDGDRLLQAADFLTTLSGIEANGFTVEERIWESVSGRPTVKIYLGAYRSDDGAIWAAIEVQSERSVRLLKIVDTYKGGDNEKRDLLADALDRLDRS